MPIYLFGKAISTPFDWLTQSHITQLFNGKSETGIDLGVPFHTPITSLTPGTVVGTGYYAGGGVVSVQSSIDGSVKNIYYQHLDTINVQKGQLVTAGTLLGLSGGQLSGGSHPSTRQYSSGPHIEVGINAPYGGMWNPDNLPGNTNPIPILQGIISGTANVMPGIAGGIGGTWFQSLLQGFNVSSGSDFAWRAGLIVGGMVLIVAGILIFFQHDIQQAGTMVIQQGQQAAGVAAKAAAA